MGLREDLHDLKRSFFVKVADIYQEIASRYGFPENKGMTFEPPEKYWWDTKLSFNDTLPVNHLRFPPETFPTNYLEIFVGGLPRPTEATRYYFESKIDGYYNFYVLNYKNNIYFPNWFSEFLQIRCHCCLDISFLELFREVFFVLLVFYNYAISMRLLLGWLMTINPYTLPFSYLVACVDWIEELSIGILPVIGGVGFATPCLLYLVGKMADFLNHLVFTMPFLPSEGKPTIIFIEGKAREALVYKNLPYLWYKYPIPNEVREYWYFERPDIRAYMEKFYGHLNIDILPDMNNLIHHVN